jgi:hypothetical protein
MYFDVKEIVSGKQKNYITKLFNMKTTTVWCSAFGQWRSQQS